jgi:hypothetical protein
VLVVKGRMGNTKHQLRPLPAAPLVVLCRYLTEVPSPLLAALLVVRRTMLWPSRRYAQAHARLAVRSRVDDRARVTYAAATPAVRKVSVARQHLSTIADNAKCLVNYILGSWGHVMRTRRLRARMAYVMRVDYRARVT